MTESPTIDELLQFVYLTPVGIVKFGADGAIDLVNPMAAQLLVPLRPDGDLDNLYNSLMPLVPDLRQRVHKVTNAAGIIFDKRLQTNVDGKALVLSLIVQRVKHDVYMAVLEDVTRLVEQEKRLSTDQLRFRAIFDNVRDYAIYTITLDGLIEEWNQSLQRFGGWKASDVAGHIRMFFPSDDAEAADPNSLLADAKLLGSVEMEGWLLKFDGSRLWGNMTITALPDDTGAVRGFVVVARDMTERKRMEDDLLQLATIDPLTGTFNRRHGQAYLAAEFERRARSSQPFAVLMLDIDWFKSVNDSYGHDAGDAVLCAMVDACKSQLRVLDMLVRWGGEEFLIVLPGTTAVGALVTAERLRETVAAMRVPVGESSVAFTVSIGIAVPSDNNVADLLHRADEALYAAKSRGRNRAVLAA